MSSSWFICSVWIVCLSERRVGGRGGWGAARTRGFFITVKVADTDQKGVNLLPRVSELALIPTPSLRTLKRASLQVSVSKFASWLRLRARLFITLASETHAGPWTSRPLALRFWWRGGQSSDPFCVTLQAVMGVMTPPTFGSRIGLMSPSWN